MFTMFGVIIDLFRTKRKKGIITLTLPNNGKDICFWAYHQLLMLSLVTVKHMSRQLSSPPPIICQSQLAYIHFCLSLQEIYSQAKFSNKFISALIIPLLFLILFLCLLCKSQGRCQFIMSLTISSNTCSLSFRQQEKFSLSYFPSLYLAIT